MLRSKLTDRWQTTIPAEVRKALRLQPRQRLIYEIRGQTAIIRPEGESLMDLAGSLPKPDVALSKDEARDAARKAAVERNR